MTCGGCRTEEGGGDSGLSGFRVFFFFLRFLKEDGEQ